MFIGKSSGIFRVARVIAGRRQRRKGRSRESSCGTGRFHESIRYSDIAGRTTGSRIFHRLFTPINPVSRYNKGGFCHCGSFLRARACIASSDVCDSRQTRYSSLTKSGRSLTIHKGRLTYNGHLYILDALGRYWLGFHHLGHHITMTQVGIGNPLVVLTLDSIGMEPTSLSTLVELQGDAKSITLERSLGGSVAIRVFDPLSIWNSDGLNFNPGY